ncbi:cell division ATP-binding protein FtsE [Hippea maritima]|uniref:ABC transporter related protein n=1 Tax=Hippea maritima (strain ATCC 700847 / DSM 10411 / MH2) TaxID=760142 RepID=F2LWF0_HIPMA|nr:ATP-binding cassette domain-containing protein [Hippea maritima]AEA32996.1 ABC transporter related protein [Hippea maritima DSM 10411]
MVEFIDVVKSFNKRTVFSNLSFRIAANRINQIILPQSGGKSTIIRMIYGAEKPDSGFVRVFDFNVSDLNYSGILLLRRYLGIIFEDIRLISNMTVKENLSAITKLTRRDLYLSEEIFDMLSIGHLLDKYPHELSISEQSLINIARGVIYNFPLVIADEPLRYLSEDYRIKVIRLFKYLNQDKGITFLIATLASIDDDFYTVELKGL